jgi:hypothetical protein
MRKNVNRTVVVSTAIAAVCGIGVVTVITLNNHGDSTSTVKDCAAAIQEQAQQGSDHLPEACDTLTDVQVQQAVDQTTTPSTAVPHGDWGKPIEVDAGDIKFTITLLNPILTERGVKDCGDNFICPRTLTFDSTITTTTPLDRDRLGFDTVDDNFTAGGIPYPFTFSKLPAGGTHVQRKHEISYNDEARGSGLTLWLIVRAPDTLYDQDTQRVVEWTWDGK